MQWLSDTVLNSGFQERVREILARDGRVHLPAVLTVDAAQKLHRAMDDAPWLTAFKDGAKTMEGTAKDYDLLSPEQRAGYLHRIHDQAAAKGFQFFNDIYRISAKYELNQVRDGVFADFFSAMNAPEGLQVLRALTGDDRIAYLDATATRYRPGHFLTHHDDLDPANTRLFAYVLNLTPDWIPDWGGLLMFYREDGHVERAYTPRWNALNIFKVPSEHAVSVVAPFAPAPRLSITGWMRTDRRI